MLYLPPPISIHEFSNDTDAPDDCGGIYMIVHLETGRFYVGQVGYSAKRNFAKRCREHYYFSVNGKAQHARSRFGKFVREHGGKGFEFRVIERMAKDAPQSDYDCAEQCLIDKLDASGVMGLNGHPVATSPRGIKRSEETKRKLSLARRATLAQRPDLLEQLRIRMAERGLERKKEFNAMCTDPKHMRKVEKTRAWRANQPQATPKPFEIDPEVAEFIRHKEAAKKPDGRTTDEFKWKVGTQLECIETGDLFITIREAARWLDVTPSFLRQHVVGNKKSAGGKHFRSVDAEYVRKNSERIKRMPAP